MRFMTLDWAGEAVGRLAELWTRPPQARCEPGSGNSPAKVRKTSGKRAAKKPKLCDVDAVILALIANGRSQGRAWAFLSVSDLAAVMRCSVGESSKRVKSADGEQFVGTLRCGRRKMVGLHRLTSDQWARIAASKPCEAVSLYRAYTRRGSMAKLGP